MCDLPTNEESDTSKATTCIPHFRSHKPKTFCTGRHGFNHWTTNQSRIWCHTYDRQPWMLACSNISSLPYDDNRSSDCPKISTTLISLVRTTRQNNFRSRPLVYIAFRQSIGARTGNLTKYIDSIPPSDRQTHWVHKSMGRTISATHTSKPTRLEYMTTCGNRGP